MPRRRAHNEGTITPWGKNKFRAWVTIGYDINTGKPIRKSKVLPSEQECIRWIQETKTEYGSPASKRLIKNPSTRLDDFFKDWFKYYIAPTVRESTYYNYRNIYDVHIKSALGKIPLKDLTTQHIQRLCAEKLANNLSVRTVHLIHYVISAGLKQARLENIIIHNPADAVKLPANEPSERPHLSAQQASDLLQAIGDHRYYLVYLLALTHGMRRGEILGLTWSSVDLERRTIAINNSLSRVRKVDAKEGEKRTALVVENPKTKYSRRIIPMSDHVHQQFIHMKKLQQEVRLSSDYVLQTANSTPCSPDNLLRFHRKTITKHGLPYVTFHDLRHTFATLAGEPPVSGSPYVIKSILGHSNRDDITAHYTHTTHKAMLEVIEKLTDHLGLNSRGA